ncbi:hypothetical protein CP532_5817 [Ophiocordyceps camponoti-leonardi (nom. inval.)]|nr:hypothetical protein CP532_5817 [Ophiocordyceps camponoti-leonardi (nom. inval.)]
MSEPAEQPELASPGQKRKREEAGSPEAQRPKRTAPPAAMSADTAAFIESAIEASQAAAAAAASGVSVADFSALQQAAAAEHSEPTDPSNATSTAQAALGMYPTLHVPASTEEQFAAQAVTEGDHGGGGGGGGGGPDSSYNPDVTHSDSMMEPPPVSPSHGPPPANGVQPRYSTSSSGNVKPSVGSEEWHKMRKDNHKEVERRRRETINEGINELAKIVPGCEKNKGSILQRAVSFISQLKENEQQNIEKWTLEKLLTEQAITELSASNDKLKQECERLYRELETWKRVAQNAGLEPPQPKEEPASTAPSS